MPRAPTRVFKKRKRSFNGIQVQQLRKLVCDLERTPRPSTSTNTDQDLGLVDFDVSTPDIVEASESSSKKKIGSSLDHYDKYEAENDNEYCNDIINLSDLETLLSEIAVCVKCSGPLSIHKRNRLGLSLTVCIKCNDCGYEVSSKNSKQLAGGRAEINVRTVYAFRSIGKGEQGARTWCGVMNLPSPLTFKRYNKLLCTATKSVCEESMKEAAKECVQENDGDKDVTAIFDGTWQRRGFSSLNGVLTAIAANTGKVVDVRVYSKFCRCKNRLDNNHNLNKCQANFNGASGMMEVAGAVDMFYQSEFTRGLRYKFYLGDGDSAAFPTVLKEKPYGDELIPEKLECVAHVRKRMGTRLRNLKVKMGKSFLPDGKSIGGRGRLTKVIIDEIQTYYGLAIVRNTDSLAKMKVAVWATYFHLMSSNESPSHGACPTGLDSWCKYQKAISEGKPYDHKAHTHLPEPVMKVIKPIFKDLSNEALLRKCLHGQTQNPSESLNSVIWSRIPKTTFVMLNTLELGVYEAVASFNMGNVVKCNVLEKCGINPGSRCVTEMKQQDLRRIAKAEKAQQEIEKRCRKKLSIAKKRLEDGFEDLEDPDNPSYGAGMH